MTVETIEAATPAANGRVLTITGWALTALTTAFLAMDCVMKLADLAPVRAAQTQLGYPLGLDRPIGGIELACLVLYAIPRTSVVGAVLMTGLFGGAIASHLRLGDPLFSHVLFGVYLGLLAWAGLWCRNPRLRAILPLAR